MLLNDAGRMIDTIWHEMPEHYPGIALDVMQIMPNHLHGMIVVSEVKAPRVRLFVEVLANFRTEEMSLFER